MEEGSGGLLLEICTVSTHPEKPCISHLEAGSEETLIPINQKEKR